MKYEKNKYGKTWVLGVVFGCVWVGGWVGGCGRLILTLSLFYIEFIILNAMQVLSFLI